MLIEVYMLAVENSEGSFQLANHKPGSVDMPLCFSESHAEFMFQFAEQKTDCSVGDKILLLKGRIDMTAFTDSQNFSMDFIHKLYTEQSLSNWQVLKEREAECSDSDLYRNKVMAELNRHHIELLNNKGGLSGVNQGIN